MSVRVSVFIGYQPHSLVALTICGWAATLTYLCCSLLHGHSCILPTEEFQKASQHQEKLTEHLAKSGFQGYPAEACRADIRTNWQLAEIDQRSPNSQPS